MVAGPTKNAVGLWTIASHSVDLSTFLHERMACGYGMTTPRLSVRRYGRYTSFRARRFAPGAPAMSERTATIR
jgi:hypothetical protein